MDMIRMHEILSAIWVVWFFLIFTGILVWVLRPGSREAARRHAQIPFRHDPN
ncbi:cytochrome c oxidase cbb3-type subunit 4 [Humitalea rosea]|uniref:Cytochrome c oxidase cbb3-type subunit 4 n=1 Tax=Humitalea rosea TaxID=990373 RepID=A0A2W7IA99_9PROT|nr:cbb3-type cytochrome c oxidase subunit 3 [Humitalea rosea]PZW43048.1 cytochrome c oxidase cbb3-type subunit 4 [Humitalea rosea]